MVNAPLALRLCYLKSYALADSHLPASAPRSLKEFSGTVEGHLVLLCMAGLKGWGIIIIRPGAALNQPLSN